MLGAWHATAIVVGTIIGSGIFLVPYEMMRATGSGPLVYLAWITGGILSLFGAMSYAELGASMPLAGGEYAFLRRAYGDLPAFLDMWNSFSLAVPASIATIAMGFVRTLGVFHAFRGLDNVCVQFPLVMHWSQFCAMGAVWTITGLNYLGAKKAANFHLFFTWLKVLLVLTVVCFCFASPVGNKANFAGTFPGALGGFAGFMVALTASLWAYDGWVNLATLAGEVKRPERNLPIGLIAGVGIVGALYLATNAAIQYVLPAAKIATSPRPAAAAMFAVSGHAGAVLVSAGLALSILVTLNGSTMAGARSPFAAAQDGLFFRRLGRVHPRFQSPSTALVVQAWMGTLLLLLIGEFQQLFELAIFSEWLFYALTVSSVFVFRRREKTGAPTFRSPGFPVFPAIFILAAAVLTFHLFTGNLRNSLIGLAIILAGVPLFYLIRSKAESPMLP